MRPNRKLFLSISGGIAILAALTLWWNHVPEPRLNGIGLGHYLDKAPQQADLLSIVPQFGHSAVSYLAKQIEPDPIRELIHNASQKLKFEPAALLKDRIAHHERRARAIYFLTLLGTDAVEAAFPTILTIAERPDDPVFHIALPLLQLALGTEQEVRALHALIAATRLEREPWSPRKFAKQVAYEMLPKFKNHPDIIMPPLIDSLHEPGGYKRIDIVVGFGRMHYQPCARRPAAKPITFVPQLSHWNEFWALQTWS